MSTPEINTHNMRMDRGRHKGELYTRLPVSYLRWMVNAGHVHAAIAQAELDRRGTTTPDLDVSGHAMDRASLSCRKIWHENRKDDEGLYSWLCRAAAEALATEPDEKGRHRHLGMFWAFEKDGVWPVLKTVMRIKDGQ